MQLPFPRPSFLCAALEGAQVYTDCRVATRSERADAATARRVSHEHTVSETGDALGAWGIAFSFRRAACPRAPGRGWPLPPPAFLPSLSRGAFGAMATLRVSAAVGGRVSLAAPRRQGAVVAPYKRPVARPQTAMLPPAQLGALSFKAAFTGETFDGWLLKSARTAAQETAFLSCRGGYSGVRAAAEAHRRLPLACRRVQQEEGEGLHARGHSPQARSRLRVPHSHGDPGRPEGPCGAPQEGAGCPRAGVCAEPLERHEALSAVGPAHMSGLRGERGAEGGFSRVLVSKGQ